MAWRMWSAMRFCAASSPVGSLKMTAALGGVAFGEEQHERYMRSGLRSVEPGLALAVFGGAGCVSAIVDRVVHKVEIVKVDGDSYRQKEAMELAERKATERKNRARQRRPS